MKRRVRVRTGKVRLMPVMPVPPRTARMRWPGLGVEATRGPPDRCEGNRHPPLSRLYPASCLPAVILADNDGVRPREGCELAPVLTPQNSLARAGPRPGSAAADGLA